MGRKKNAEPNFDDIKRNMPKEIQDFMDENGLNSLEDLLYFTLKNGFDPMKLATPDIDIDECRIEKGSKLDQLRQQMLIANEDGMAADEKEEEDWENDENWLDWFALPAGLLIGNESKEYHIRVKLNDAPVPVWREMLVPSNVSLELLSLLIIEAMGWENCHLHQFTKNNVTFMDTASLKESQGWGYGSSRMMHDTNEITLGNVLKEKGDRMKFEYDFGDSWNHDIWVKGIRDYDEGEQPQALMLKGKGACPPEDCGGIWGYANLLRISDKKRKTKDEKEQLEWYGIEPGFDPEEFCTEMAQDNFESIWAEVLDEMKERKNAN